MVEPHAREQEIRDLARHIAELGGTQRAKGLNLSWWSDRLLARSLVDPAFRARLFRFVDAFPALRSDEEVEEHLRSEFEGTAVPRWFGAGLGLSKNVPGGSRLSAGVARRGIDRMARQFIIGADPKDVAHEVGELWARNTSATVDLLGEHTYSESEADRYAERLVSLIDALGKASPLWAPNVNLENDSLGPVPRGSVSMKATTLASAFSPLGAEEGIERATRRLLPVLRRACELGVSVYFDMERYEEKDLTHRLFRRVLAVPGLESLHAGIVVQAYLRDAAEDLESLATWARGRRVAPSVRLVKGAYWDTETVRARAHDWPLPVFERKTETDANYERLTRKLLEHHGTLRAAFATHNLRSIAQAVVSAKELGIGPDGFELQLLYGMAEPVHEALRRSGMRLRVYAPVGELIPGMAYLVRRLLENTSNESFVRHHFAEGEALEELLDPPDVEELPSLGPCTRRAPTIARSPTAFRPEPQAEWYRASVREQFTRAVEAEFDMPPRQIAAEIGGEKVRTAKTFSSVDPSDPDNEVARVTACGRLEVEQAVRACGAAYDAWSRTDPAERASLLFRAAEKMRSRRFELAALEVHETGRGWVDADADVCEAIDYCEYYGRRMLSLARGGEVQSPPGEVNRLVYRARGVCAVISPWNFPLAIPAGMTSAALVAGNTVVLKPAEQAPATAAELVEIFNGAGLPPGVLAFVPGDGTEAGAPLAESLDVNTIAFTGSREVGLSIVESSARRRDGRRSIERVIAELGGKNAIVVDSDADLDEVVPAVIESAFGFAGQKCSAASRLIIVDAVHDEVIERVSEAARSLVIAPPRRPGSQLGPVIDEEAFVRINKAVSDARDVGRVVLERSDVPKVGWYVGPVIVTDVDPGSWLANEELFGPVLASFRVPDFESALDLANRVDYALTAGVFSRSAEHIALATRLVRAGNLYVNRAITGAVVGRQPFGGTGMSGVGSKAGGPDYLLQFLDPQAVSENTVRQGFAPEALDRAVDDRSSSPASGEQSLRSPDGPADGRGIA